MMPHAEILMMMYSTDYICSEGLTLQAPGYRTWLVCMSQMREDG